MSPTSESAIAITAALTGPIATPADHPGLPVTPAAIASSAAACAEAGAAVVHVHLRDADGRPTADPEIGRRTLELIADSSDALVQLSTGVGLDVPFADRAKLVELRPRMASLNVCSMTFGSGEFRNPTDGVRRLAERMGELDVKPELEVYDTGHIGVALALAQEGLLTPPLQFSLVVGVRGGMPATARALTTALELLPDDAIWQVVAVGKAHLPLTTLAIALGGNARTGLEDTLMISRGELAPDSATLVRRTAEIAATFGRQPLSPDAVAQMLKLPTAVAA